MKVKVFNRQTQSEVTELDLTEALHEEESYLVGRSATASLVLESAEVSRLHGKFFQQDGSIYYMDLGSRNGSSINGNMAEVKQEYSLHAGDVIQAGEFVLVMQPDEAATEVDLSDATVVKPMDQIDLESFVHRSNATEIVEGEMLPEQSTALVKIEPQDEHPDDPKQQTLALFAALNKRILNELQATGNLTRDAYLNAIRKARHTIEHQKFVDPDEIEKQAEKNWQTFVTGTSTLGGRLGAVAVQKTSELGSRLGTAAVKGATNLGNRLGAATKAAFNAAWQEIKTPQTNEQSLNLEQTSDPDQITVDVSDAVAVDPPSSSHSEPSP
ncbi:FHA domain-containing protein [Pseudanabaenaceae cyanobacterium LEGE 13415]|nr:FHA domain-containing protein [Pseudanabaenaceae cyanobacterium LEGE 13415]